MLFTNIQLDDFSPTLARLLERLSIEEPEAREWSVMAAINMGTLLKYGRPQDVLRCADVLGVPSRGLVVLFIYTLVLLVMRNTSGVKQHLAWARQVRVRQY